MGVPGLWDILHPAGEAFSMAEISVVQGFEANPGGHRGFRIGIDASIWFYHAAHVRMGENPELRTLFFRCCRLMASPFLPLFVFDGPNRPSVKRGKHISGKDHWLTIGMKNIIDAFGFEWRTAPGEAEAELAYLNRIGIIDAVLSDDVDSFLFGAVMVIRNQSDILSADRGDPMKKSGGKDGTKSYVTYKSDMIVQHPEIGLTRGGLILIGLLSGGDYHQGGLARCGPRVAHSLAKCGFGDSLLDALDQLSRDELLKFLKEWRQQVRDELKTNSQGYMKKKNPSLAQSVPEDFPDIGVLLSYARPLTSESEGRSVSIGWAREPDLGKVAGLCELYFEWGWKETIIKRFRTLLWPGVVLRLLRLAALEGDGRASLPATTREKCALTEIDTEQILIKIHSSRRHASTNGILEYRLEVAPARLVCLSEAGVKGIRPSASTHCQSEEDDGDGLDSEDAPSSKSHTKAPPDPNSHLRVWIPASVLNLAAPRLIDEYENARRRKEVKSKSCSTKRTAKVRPKARWKEGDGPHPFADPSARFQTLPTAGTSSEEGPRSVSLFHESGGSTTIAAMRIISEPRGISSSSCGAPLHSRKPTVHEGKESLADDTTCGGGSTGVSSKNMLQKAEQDRLPTPHNPKPKFTSPREGSHLDRQDHDHELEVMVPDPRPSVTDGRRETLQSHTVLRGEESGSDACRLSLGMESSPTKRKGTPSSHLDSNSQATCKSSRISLNHSSRRSRQGEESSSGRTLPLT